jgi:cell wall-associated NlpC family hydrolase
MSGHGVLYQIVTRSAPLYAAPNAGSEMVSEMLFGETLQALEDQGGWIKARSLRDSYEGYVAIETLGTEILDPTHQVSALQSFVYRKPDYKDPPLTAIPFLARLTLMGEPAQNGFVEMEGGGWIWAGHLEDITETHADYTATALRFVGTPYLWGGRSVRGLDCSGLVQLALLAAGRPCPRDTKDQIHLGQAADIARPPRRGDLVFFERHVGIMTDEHHILNATARTMDARVEMLDEMVKHYKGGVLAIRRLQD